MTAEVERLLQAADDAEIAANQPSVSAEEQRRVIQEAETLAGGEAGVPAKSSRVVEPGWSGRCSRSGWNSSSFTEMNTALMQRLDRLLRWPSTFQRYSCKRARGYTGLYGLYGLHSLLKEPVV